MKIKKPKVIAAVIPTASMADIAFLLIIFFMVSSVFPVDKTQVDLPNTADVKPYNEDSAVIAITTENIEYIRKDRNRNIEDLEFAGRDKVIIKASDGRTASTELYQYDADTWNLAVESQFEKLRDSMKSFLNAVERRSVQEGGRQIIIVIKADAKTPFYAVDGVIEALQELGGRTASSLAIMSELEGS